MPNGGLFLLPCASYNSPFWLLQFFTRLSPLQRYPTLEMPTGQSGTAEEETFLYSRGGEFRGALQVVRNPK